MLKMLARKTRRVTVTITLPHRRATLSHYDLPRRMTVGQLLEWLAQATHGGVDYLYALRDTSTGGLLSNDETLGQLARRRGRHLHLHLHIEPRMA